MRAPTDGAVRADEAKRRSVEDRFEALGVYGAIVAVADAMIAKYKPRALSRPGVSIDS